MITVALRDEKTGDPLWIDVNDPAPGELESIAERYRLHPEAVADCLEPQHLPKFEKIGDTTFIMVRAYDPKAQGEGNSPQAMTRKLALFLGDRFLITVHRHDFDFLRETIREYEGRGEPIFLQAVLIELLISSVETYHFPLEEAEETIGGFEESFLNTDPNSDPEDWQTIFRLKNRLMVIKRLLWHTLNAVQKFSPHSSANLPLAQDLRERIESLQFFADSLLDDIANLLSVLLNLSSHRMNDIMRVLTLFSVFFLPLNLIAGIYGMNFVNMPELRHPLGYPAVLSVIACTGLGVVLWFRKRGWIKRWRSKRAAA